MTWTVQKFGRLHVLCAFLSILAPGVQAAAEAGEPADQPVTQQQTGSTPGVSAAESLRGGNIAFGGLPAVLDERSEGPAPRLSAKEALRVPAFIPPAEPFPGTSRVVLSPVTPAQSEDRIHSRELPSNLNPPPGDSPMSLGPSIARTAGIAAAGTPSSDPVITELARALRNDPDLIYRYVHDNIAHYPVWGVQKGDLGAVLDKSGTAFDQAALMVALLRASGYEASYIKGRIELNAARVQGWLGVDTGNVCAVLNLLGQGQIPVSSVLATVGGSCPGTDAALVSLKLDHLWVKTNIDGTDYVFDPGFKSHADRPGINLAAATGYDAAGYLGDATSRATITDDYVQNIDRARIRDNLADYANNLAGYLRTNLPSGTLEDVVGGETIVPHDGSQLRQSVLPYQDNSAAIVEWAEIPDSYRTVLAVAYQGIDVSYTSDRIYGRRLSITYDAGNQPVLLLDGIVQAAGNPVVPGTVGDVVLSVTHGAYARTSANQDCTLPPAECTASFPAIRQQIRAGGTYVIGNGWGPAGRGLVEHHRKHLEQARAENHTVESEALVGPALAVLSASWIAQVNRADAIADRLADTNTLFHHQVGIAGYNGSSYVDLPGNMLSVVSQQADTNMEDAVFFSATMHGSIFESASVQQTAGIAAVSTVKLIDLAVSGNQPIYDAVEANYTSAVEPNLVGCASRLAGFSQAVSSGRRLILPERCDLTEGDWSGAGYFDINRTAFGTSVGAIIGGGLAGGFSTQEQPAAELTSNAEQSAQSSLGTYLQYTGNSYGDPVDMTKGHYLYDHEDMTLGEGTFPRSLSFRRLYSSGLNNRTGPLGPGWSHNLSVQATRSSDGFQSLGEDSALDAVAAVVELMVSLDLLADPDKPLDKLVVATLGQRWFGDQFVHNTVAVQKGLNGEVFVKLPDGNYNPPPGNPAQLIEKADGTYSYETLHGDRLDFNIAGRIALMQEPSGIQVRFSYDGSALVHVRNSLGRKLSLRYAGGRLTQVSDGSRTIGFGYDGDGDGNLSRFTDATGQSALYEYDVPGRLARIFYPSHPTNAFVTNLYDSLGRVKTQTNANGAIYNYYFAGTRSEEVGPYDTSRISFPNALGKILRSVDPLGRVTAHKYDGQQRIIETEFPEGNRLEYVYDDGPCAVRQRCTHNLASLRQGPKPASDLPELITSYTYEGAVNRVESVTDPRGQVTSYAYTERGEPLTVTRPADGSGQRPITAYGYSPYSAAGFPSIYLQSSVTRQIDATNSTTRTTTYDPGNRYVTQSTLVDSGDGGLNLLISYSYDGIGNLTGVDGPRTDVADVQALIYDPERRPIETRDALGNLTRSAYDPDGRLIRVAAQSANGWLVSCRSHSPTGKLLRAWGPSETGSDTLCPPAAPPVGVTDYAYDELDRRIRTTEFLLPEEGGNRVTEVDYFPDDLLQTSRSAVGTSLEQVSARYAYTPNGGVASVQDANGNLTGYEYDGHDRTVTASFPDPMVAGASSASDYEQYGYDENGNLTSIRKRNGGIVSLAYDGLDRLQRRTYPDAAADLTYEYDLLGRRTSLAYADGSQGINHAYDNAGRVLSTSSGGRTIGYQYDAAGNRTRITWPDGFFVTLTYDALDRPTETWEQGAALLASYEYDSLSRRNQVARGNSTATTYGFDAQSGLASIFHDLPDTEYDITSRYTRNQVAQITNAQSNNYRYLWLPEADVSSTYGANGLNQYTQVNGQSFAYDANGNLTSGGAWTYGYDMENRLISASKPGATTTLAYDPAGRMHRTDIDGSVTDLLYDGSELIGEYDGNGGLQKRYVHGPGIDEPIVTYEGPGTASKQWLYADHLGSVIATADSVGVTETPYAYGPYGEPDRTDGPRFRYTGQQLIASLGLYHYKARFYSPALGRFLQTDPIGYADGLNLYAYVGNDPVNYTDPDGRTIINVAGAVFGAVSGGIGAYVSSGGKIGAAATGAAIGAVAGLVSPATTIGNAVLGFGSSVAGQLVGSRSVKDVDFGLAAVSTIGGLAGKGLTKYLVDPNRSASAYVINRSLGPGRNSVKKAVKAVTQGFIGGLTEAWYENAEFPKESQVFSATSGIGLSGGMAYASPK